MSINRIVMGLIITVSCIFISKISFSNGINPPRPTQFPVLAEYTKTNDSKTHKLYRVHVKSGTSSYKSLTFQTDESNEDIPLYEIQKITILSSTPNDNGLIQVELLLLNDEESQPSMLIAKKGATILKLSGFKSNGNKSSIALTKCKEINFSYKSTDDFDRWEGNVTAD